jgi:8-oxo-dGTP pyrophosphatase MutT (NUDIX family)
MRRDARLRESVRAQLGGFERRALAPAGRHAAAVALAIVDQGPGAALPGLPGLPGWSTAAAFLLTRRGGHLRRHAGQWALPGGRVDDGETPEQAALRELDEEVGVRLAAPAVLGRLDDVPTRSGFVITPVVVWAGAARELRPDAAEVASVHRVPLSELLRTDAPWLDPVPGQQHPVLRMPLGSSWVAAPTAAVLYQFRELALCGRPTRVAHFEQPRFAWR